MTDDTVYRINEPGVIAEEIEGEVVILNFERGTYYSLNASGMLIWKAVGEGLSATALVQRMAEQFPDSAQLVEDHAKRLLRELLEEELLVVSEAGAASDAPQTEAEPATIEYAEPRLEKFTDLQDLLLLDPIHDVGETGWPNQS